MTLPDRARAALAALAEQEGITEDEVLARALYLMDAYLHARSLDETLWRAQTSPLIEQVATELRFPWELEYFHVLDD